MQTFEWVADLECEDLDGLEAVVRVVHWRCIARADEFDACVSGATALAAPDPAAFISAPEEVTGAVIRVWIGEEIAAAAEASAVHDLARLVERSDKRVLAAPVVEPAPE